MLTGTYSVPGEGLLPRISRIWRGWRALCWGRGVWRRQVCAVFHLMVIIIGGWCHRVGGDGIDVGGPDDTHPGPTVVFHAHADTYGNSSNYSHDEHDSKYYASNCRARKNIPNVGIVGATVRCGSIAAVRFTVFATVSKAILCADKEQDQLRKQDPWTPGHPPRVHPGRWPEVARQDRTSRTGPWRRLRAEGEPSTGRGCGRRGRSDGAGSALERGVAR